MQIRTGCDLVQIRKFQQAVTGAHGALSLERIFSPQELSHHYTIETLAGLFAAKEAVIKALNMAGGSWQEIEIEKADDGRPSVRLTASKKNIESIDVSVTHDGEYAMATAAVLLS